MTSRGRHRRRRNPIRAHPHPSPRGAGLPSSGPWRRPFPTSSPRTTRPRRPAGCCTLGCREVARCRSVPATVGCSLRCCGECLVGKVVAGLVERGGRAAAAPPRGIPGGEVHDGAGDACVERRAGVGRGRGGGDRERRVEEQRRHLGVLVLPHRQRVDDARDDDVAPLPRDVRSGGGISENTRERTRVPGARRVQSLALGRERALSVRGRRPGLGV